VETVPIFWLATEDHDLAEVSSATLYEKNFGLRKLSVAAQAAEGAPVGTARFGDELRPIVQEAVELLGESEAAEILRESYTPGASFGDAFAKLFSRLFAEFGVIILDASDTELHRIAEPVYAAAAERAQEINSALMQRDKALEHAGYHAQVKVTGSSTTLFMLQDGVRTPVHRVNSHFSVGKEKFSLAELVARVKANPEEFSANALMRPAVQDYLLPTLAYVGGPAEVAYFAQSAVVYEKLLGRVTPILPRISATLVEPKIERLLGKYRLTVAETFQGPEHLRQLLASRTLPTELAAEFDSAKADVERHLKAISDQLQQLDPTLVDAAKKSESKIIYQFSRLQSRAATALVRKDADIARHGEQISSALFPHKNLQEREIAGIAFIARYGIDLLRQIHDGGQTNCPDHHVFYL
jgi:bacillithiol biosynthesis cysteine-adding enzyme BshC